MTNPDSSKPSSLGHSLYIGEDGLPHIVEHVDGITTGLDAIGLAIIEAGFAGVHGLAVAGKNILWQVLIGTPEGVFFTCLCDAAKRGHRLPSAEQVLEIIRSFLVSKEGQK